MRLGIFGGTFNPVHCGHLINAEMIRSDFGLDRVVLVPAQHPVHKELDGNVPGEDRFEMARRAVENLPGYDVSRIEIDRKGPSYTITTIHEFGERYPGADLHLIIGMDMLNEIDTWREAERLLKSVTLVVMRRPGTDRHPEMDLGPYRVRYAGNPLVDISSTCVRERIRSGKSVRFLLPERVMEYIMEKGLYRP